MKIIKVFDQFFLLSKSERNGAIVLLTIVSLLFIVRFSLPLIFSSNKSKAYIVSGGIEQFEEFQDSTGYKTIIAKKKNIPTIYTSLKNETYSNDKLNGKNSSLKALVKFNPNQTSFKELINIGFSQTAAKSMINYRLKGGVFKKADDIKKIYGIDSIFFKTISPFIFIPENADIKANFELNSADSAEFTRLRGVGPVFASRICKFRNQLGGFVSIGQLKEVYKFPVETYDDINDLLTIDLSKVKKININFAGLNDLKKHPYCKYENARKIIDFRSKNGYIANLESLINENVIDTFTFNRLSPYLKIE